MIDILDDVFMDGCYCDLMLSASILSAGICVMMAAAIFLGSRK